MTITLPDTGSATDLEILEALDFKPELPCESPFHDKSVNHDGPGELLVASRHRCTSPDSDRNLTRLLCRKVWEAAGVKGIQCRACKQMAKRDEWWTIVGGV